MMGVLSALGTLSCSKKGKDAEASDPTDADDGPMEKAGAWTDEAAEDTGDAVEDAADDTEDAGEEADDEVDGDPKTD
jgi:hypothetical protein